MVQITTQGGVAKSDFISLQKKLLFFNQTVNCNIALDPSGHAAVSELRTALHLGKAFSVSASVACSVALLLGMSLVLPRETLEAVASSQKPRRTACWGEGP